MTDRDSLIDGFVEDARPAAGAGGLLLALAAR